MKYVALVLGIGLAFTPFGYGMYAAMRDGQFRAFCEGALYALGLLACCIGGAVLIAWGLSR